MIYLCSKLYQKDSTQDFWEEIVSVKEYRINNFQKNIFDIVLNLKDKTVVKNLAPKPIKLFDNDYQNNYNDFINYFKQYHQTLNLSNFDNTDTANVSDIQQVNSYRKIMTNAL